MQLELNRIDEWCSEMNGKIHPDKASTLWLTLNNHAVNAVMPNVSIGDKAIKREDTLRYLGIIFDRSLSGKDHITRIVQRSRKGLTALKTMAGAKMPQKILVILYQALVVSVMEYGLGLLTLSKSQLQRLDVIQNEGMRAILGCTKDTSAEAMRYLLDLPTASERHKLAQVKAYLKVASDKKHPLHDKIGREYTSRLKRGSEWTNQAAVTIGQCLSVDSVRRGEAWLEIPDEAEQFTAVIANLGRECREWAPGAANAEIEATISEVSGPDDVIVFTDGSVKRGEKSGWAFTARVNGITVSEGSGAVEMTASSMAMEVKAVTEALQFLATSAYKKAVIVTDSMSTLQKIQKGMLYSDWIDLIKRSELQTITWLFCPGHSGVQGNERADELAGTAVVGDQMTLDSPLVLATVKNDLCSKRPESTSYTLKLLHDKNIKAGEGRHCELRGVTRRQHNQLLMETVSLKTLRSTLKARGEQMWECPGCRDPYAEDQV